MGPNGKGRPTPRIGGPAVKAPGQDQPAPRAPVEPPPITVRPATDADAMAAAALHAGQISQGFLSLLGPEFLRLLYRRINRSPDSILLIADSEGATAGFIAGSTDVAGLYRSFLWHDGIRAVLAAAGPLVSGWRHVVETLGHGSSNGVGVGRGAEVLAVAVDPAWQGRGVGRLLLVSLLDEFRSRGGDAAHVVVGADNDAAIALYERVGFVAQEHFELHVGTESLLMQWEHRSDPAGADAGPQ